MRHNINLLLVTSLLAFSTCSAKKEETPFTERATMDFLTMPYHRDDLFNPMLEALDMDHLVEMTKLQLWTLKPALKPAL